MSFSQAAEKIELESTPLQEARLRITHESKLYFGNSALFYILLNLILGILKYVLFFKSFSIFVNFI
jgi:hypothetical protein